MAKKSRRKKTTAKSAPARTSGGLSGVSITDLTTEIRRRQRRLSTLERKRERLASELASLDAEIRELGGSMGGGALEPGRKRPRNTKKLPDALADVLKGKTMGVQEAADAVQAAGYQSSSANFRNIVNQVLISDKRFKRVDRGQYTSK